MAVAVDNMMKTLADEKLADKVLASQVQTKNELKFREVEVQAAIVVPYDFKGIVNAK